MAGREHAAPRLPEHVVAVVNAKMVEEVVQLVDEELHGPERGVTGLLLQVCRLATADLIVEDDGNLTCLCEVGDGEQVVMRDARATGEDD